MNLTTHLHLVPKLRMSGFVTLFPIRGFVIWKNLFHSSIKSDRTKTEIISNKSRLTHFTIICVLNRCVLEETFSIIGNRLAYSYVYLNEIKIKIHSILLGIITITNLKEYICFRSVEG